MRTSSVFADADVAAIWMGKNPLLSLLHGLAPWSSCNYNGSVFVNFLMVHVVPIIYNTRIRKNENYMKQEGLFFVFHFSACNLVSILLRLTELILGSFTTKHTLDDKVIFLLFRCII